MASLFFGLAWLLVQGVPAPQNPTEQPPAWIESRILRPDKIWIGLRVDLQVTLYARGSFTGVPHFDLPKEAGLLILGDDSRPLLGSKDLEGVSYLSKQYNLALFPLRAGRLELPSFDIGVEYLTETRNKVSVTFATKAWSLDVLAIPGADPTLPLLTSTHLVVEDHWDPQPGKAKVGDAFSRRITLTAEGLPGMALTPLEMPRMRGLAVYPGQPQVDTDTHRGAFSGRRRQDWSFVFERPGKYRVPSIRLQWWNPASLELEQVTLDAVAFDVAPNPAWQETGEEVLPDPGSSSGWLGGLAFASILIVSLLAWYRMRRRHQAGARAETTPSEARLFADFRKAAASNDPAASMRMLMQWIDATVPSGLEPTLGCWVRSTGDAELEEQIEVLQKALYGPGSDLRVEAWSGAALDRLARRARRRGYACVRRSRSACRHCLQSLNPGMRT